jgi:hypothetical protein
MRIDAASLLLASQLPPARPAPSAAVNAGPVAAAAAGNPGAGTVKVPETGEFQPLIFSSAAPAGNNGKLAPPLMRPGSQLDIKV